MTTETKKKRQNSGSHMKNIRGSAFRKAWISEWLNKSENDGRHYKDAVKAYIAYKATIAARWAKPVGLLLDHNQPCDRFVSYGNLLEASKANVNFITQALTANESDTISYWNSESEEWEVTDTTGWMKEEEKYLNELTKPSGQTGKWIRKLRTLCEEFGKIKTENQIVPGLEKIVNHCTYPAGEPEGNDNLPLYKYPAVQRLYAAIAANLKSYQTFVINEMKTGYPGRKVAHKE